MLTALSTALSGLNAQSIAIDVVGNNLANLNTTGFKAQSTEFYDLVSQSLGGPATQIGMGVGTPLTNRVFSQGGIQQTSDGLDVAIQGDGFLVTKTANGATLYTRSGNLNTDAAGNLLDASGNYIQGWSAVNGIINTANPIGNLTVPVGSLNAPVATQNMSLGANLDSSAAVVTAGTETASNASFSTGIEVYDSLGTSHMVTLNFWNNGGGSWKWQASVPSSDLTDPTASTVGGGTLTFNSTGQLTTPAAATASPVLTIPGLADGANDMTVNFNLYDGSSPLITQFDATSAPSGNTQDGSATAQLTDVAISNGGSVVGSYSNGAQVTVGQLAMANFANPDSLLAVGGNSYQTTGETSNPSIGLPNSGGRGEIKGSSLESSTVDIATEFTNLMVDQRAYQANAKVITSADQLNQDTIDLIR